MNPNEALRCILLQEFKIGYRSGIYGFTQRALAFNSNKIEGSTLTPEQTASLFEEGYLPSSNDIYHAKDVEEMTGHFLMFNKMLVTIDQPITEDLIKSFHYELKAGVFEDRANGYAIGDYKRRRNVIGGNKTTDPAEVANEMRELLQEYNKLQEVTLAHLAEFHSRYEIIHPFQDGNGRTGRLILFRECLRNDIIPFIIQDINRARYIEALKAARLNNFSPLVALFREEQDAYNKELNYFEVEAAYKDYLNAQPNKITI